MTALTGITLGLHMPNLTKKQNTEHKNKQNITQMHRIYDYIKRTCTSSGNAKNQVTRNLLNLTLLKMILK